MALPANWTQITVTGTYKNRDGSPASGWVTFESRQPVIIGGEIIVPKTITGVIDGSGYLSVQVPATNDPDLSVTGWAYKVTEHVEGGRPPYMIEVPYGGGPINLATAVPAVSTPTQPVTSYLRATDLGNSVAAQASLPSLSVMSYGATGNGVTNDTAAFAAALAVGASLKRTVFAPPGTYQIDALTLPAGSRLQGAGTATIIRPFSVPSGSVLVAGGDDVEISHLKIDAPAATYFNTVPLLALAVRRFYAHDLTISGGGSSFIGASCTDSVVERLNVSGFVNNGISFDGAGTARNKIALCNVDGTASTGGGVSIQCLNGINCQILGNAVTGAYAFGCYLGSCTHSSMIGNVVRNTRLEGLQATDSNYCLIDGNIAVWDGAAGQDFGISLWSTLAAGGKYNTISNNTITRSGKAGIQIEGTGGFSTSYNNIINNTIINPNWLNEASAAAVMTYGVNCTDTLIDGNTIFSDNGKMSYGVREVDGGGYPSNSVIGNNKITGQTVAKISKGPSSTEKLNGKRLTDSTWTPVITSQTGTLGTTSVSEATYYEMERMVYISLAFTITTVGTGAGWIAVTVPYNIQSGRTPSFACNNVNVGISMLRAEANGSTLIIRKSDGTTAIVAGGIYTVGGWYERD